MFNLVERYKNDSFISRNIDVLRGIAIIIVILLHVRNFISSYGVTPADINIANFMIFGASGVGLFFFISGFLLDFLYRKEFIIKQYFVRRMGRIFPAWLFWNIVALVVASFGIVWWFQNDKIMDYAYGSALPITNVQGFAGFVISVVFLGWLKQGVWNSFVPGGWSIQAEIFNYTIFPIINKIKLEITLFVLIVISYLALLFHWDKNQIASVFITSPYWFVLGILISRLIRRHAKKDESEDRLTLITWALFAGLTLFNFFLQGPFVSQKTTMVVVVYSLIVAYLFTLSKGYISNLIIKIGKMSYGMYFNHFLLALPFAFVAWSVYKSLNLNPVGYLITILITFAVVTYVSYWLSKATYKLFEKKFILLSHGKKESKES